MVTVMINEMVKLSNADKNEHLSNGLRTLATSAVAANRPMMMRR